jgi:large subunit ribosomal protein L35
VREFIPEIFQKNPVARPVKPPTFTAAMARSGGKAKTRKSVAKRFKVTGSGRILRRKQGKRHLNRRKNAKRLRRLGQSTLVAKCDEAAIKANMPFA